MRHFLVKLSIFSSVSFVVLQLVGWVLIYTEQQGHAVENSRIYHSIEKSRQTWAKSEVFIFGDSVAYQMYPPETVRGRINSFALVMPSTLAGQYFLLQRLSKSSNLEGKTVVLLLSPNGFGGEFSHQSSYHYVLKPFHNDEFQPWSDDYYEARVKSNMISTVSQWPLIKSSNWNPPEWMPYLHQDAIGPLGGLSEFSAHYLTEIDSLMSEKGAYLRILPTVQRLSKATDSYSELKAGIEVFGLSGLFTEYFESFQYKKDVYFRDGAHVYNRAILGDNLLGL